MQVSIADCDLMDAAVGILEPDPTRPIIALGVARAAEDLERADNEIAGLIEQESSTVILKGPNDIASRRASASTTMASSSSLLMALPLSPSTR